MEFLERSVLWPYVLTVFILIAINWTVSRYNFTRFKNGISHDFVYSNVIKIMQADDMFYLIGAFGGILFGSASLISFFIWGNTPYLIESFALSIIIPAVCLIVISHIDRAKVNKLIRLSNDLLMSNGEHKAILMQISSLHNEFKAGLNSSNIFKHRIRFKHQHDADILMSVVEKAANAGNSDLVESILVAVYSKQFNLDWFGEFKLKQCALDNLGKIKQSALMFLTKTDWPQELKYDALKGLDNTQNIQPQKFSTRRIY